MTIQWLTSWWNLIFVLPFLLALAYLLIYTVSGVTFGEPDADVGADADLDGDADVDAGMHGHAGLDAHGGGGVAEIDGDVDAHVHVDAHVDSHVGAEAGGHAATHAGAAGTRGSSGGTAMNVLAWIGVGRLPVSVLLMFLMIIWGVGGFLMNTLLWPRLLDGNRVAAVSIPAAALASLLLTRVCVKLMSRYLPLNESYSRRRHELLGAVGEAVLPVGAEYGLVSVRDGNGDLFQIGCRVYRDGPAIEKGTRVRLMAYNGNRNLFYVSPEAAAAEREGSASRTNV